jgi:hypothetical protein
VNPPRPTVEPQALIAGDTLQFDRTMPNFSPVDGWALSYTLTLPGKTPIQITGGVVTSTGATWNINVPAATTANYVAGKYFWIAYVTGSGANAGQRFKVGEGVIDIKPNPATADATTDYRSDAKKNLDAIDAVLANKITSDVQSYKINGRELVKMRHDDLLELRGYYFQRYKEERIRSGEVFPSSSVGAYFGPTR